MEPALSVFPKEINSLKIIPDDQLNFIPFDLLLMKMAPMEKVDFHSNQLDYVLESYEISYDYSAILMLKNQTQERQNYKNDFIAFAPSFKKAVPQNKSRTCQAEALYDLPCSGKEVREINDIMKGDIHINQNALKSVFEKNASNYRVIHMATHACVDEANPLFNKIFLKDDYLSNADLYNTKLNAELVVLSACNTGSGKLVRGEGVLSLARGFIQAGCLSSVVTQWSVDDCTTSDIMIDFYKQLRQGLPKSKALQQAKLNHLTNAKRIESHPYYWAAFVQFGDTNNLKFDTPLRSTYKILGGCLVLLMLFFMRQKYGKKKM